MSQPSARLNLPFIAPSQAQKHVTHNEALLRLDALTQLVVEELEATTPPADPALGGIYALGAAPTDAWADEAGQLAYWDGASWLFLAPQEGWRAWDKNSETLNIYQAGAWTAQITDLQNVDGVGINAGSDAVNRLSVSSEATLLNHEGAGHQLKVNKAAPGDTASLLYQSGFTGHAEMGLTGDTDFHIKTSPDGATFYDAMVAEAATGRVRFPSGAIPAPARAYVSTLTAQTLTTNVDTYVSYETLAYDTSGFYDPGQPDRLTVPEDGGYELSTYVQVGVGFAVGEGWIIIERYTAGGTKVGSYPASWVTGYIALASPMVACQAGDYFRLLVRQNSGSNKSLLVVDDRNYLSIRRAF